MRARAHTHVTDASTMCRTVPAITNHHSIFDARAYHLHCSANTARVADTKSGGDGGGGGGGGNGGHTAALPTKAVETQTEVTRTAKPLPVAGGPLSDTGIHIIFST